MNDEEFVKTINETIGFVKRAQELQLDQLGNNIIAIYHANAQEIDTEEVAQQMLNTPIKTLCEVNKGDVPSQHGVVQHIEGAVPENNELNRVVKKDPEVEEGQIGDIWDLTRVQNAADKDYGFDFFHHCPEMQDDLVRIAYRGKIDNHICLVCNQEFYSKCRPKTFHE